VNLSEEQRVELEGVLRSKTYDRSVVVPEHR